MVRDLPPPDVFTTFKDLLTHHKPLVAQYLAEHYTDFFHEYEKVGVARPVFLVFSCEARPPGSP